jgi:hypothetical protein
LCAGDHASSALLDGRLLLNLASKLANSRESASDELLGVVDLFSIIYHLACFTFLDALHKIRL